MTSLPQRLRVHALAVACVAGATPRQVSFGVKDKWVIRTLSGNIACTVTTFGSDPNPGLREKCAVGPVSSNPPPPPPPPPSAGSASGSWAGTVIGGGSRAPVIVNTAAAMQAAINAYTGTGGHVIRYDGRFDFGSISDTCDQWRKPKGAIVEIKNKSNMTIGLLPGSIDAIGIEGQGGSAPAFIWIDHNTLFSSLKECSGAGDLEFDGLIGSSDSDRSDRFISYHHNHYKDVSARLPLQRGGCTHLYSNLYSGVKTSGANIRMGSCSLIEGNWFENAQNPVTPRDSSSIGRWELRGNNVRSPADFATYGITWVPSGLSPSRDATDWTTTSNFPIGIPYSCTLHDPSCVKARLPAVAGAGTGLARLTCP